VRGPQRVVTEPTKKRRKALETNRTRAREMRSSPVSMEKLFWSCVRNRQLGGYKFRRQVPIGPYIADFVCVERKLIVELDGDPHKDREEYDTKRDTYLTRQGYRVMRFTNQDFGSDIAIVLKTIEHGPDTGAPSP
jgi:very-short-patch-repair endonuclease